MDELLSIISEIALPSAYDHFAEGEAPQLPYLLYLIPANNNFAADNRAYFKVNEVHIELYTDRKNLSAEQQVEAVLDRHSVFMINPKYGLRAKSSMRFFLFLIWR